MINEDRKKLYDALSSEYDLGTYEEFERNIGDSVKRKKLYDAASADYDLGDFESYSQRIGPTHKESLDAFTAEHGSWLNDFEARDSAETNMSKAGMNSGIYVPSESAITGEERKRYLELHKQEEALKKAWFTSDEYLAQKDADALFLSDARNGLNKQIMEYSQSNPVLKPEGAFQINPYATRGAEADTELEKYRTASRILDDAINMHNAPSKYDGANVWQNIGKFGKGAADTLSDVDFWSMGLTEIADNLGVRDVLSTVQEKLGNLNDLSEESIENILSPAEKAVLQAWAINTQEQLKRKDDLSRGYQAGKGAAESLGFMAEFALTGGIGKAATEGVEQMAKWLGKKALTKVGGMTDDVAAKVLKETGEKIAQSTVGKYGVGLAKSLAEAAGRTGVMPSTFRNISEKATEIETDENGNNYLIKMNDAFAKGYVDSFIENLSEGGRVNALGGLIGDVAGKIPAYKRMVDKFSHTKASELWDAFNSSGVMNTLRAGGWHGLGEEYLEEWYGNALRTLTGVDKEALKDFATVDNQIVTLTSFLPMTIFGGTVSTAQVLSANKDLEKKAEALKSALMERGYDEAQANNMIDMMRGAAPAEVSETLTPIVNSVANRNTNEAAALMKPVGEFAAAVQRWQSFNTKYNYQEQEQRDGLRTQMEENLGQFWQQDENGRQTVQRGVNEKGDVVYMLGKPSAEDAEAGVTPKVAAVTSDGRKVFVNPSEYQLEDELEMNVFLGNEIMAEKGNKEQARMIEEKEAKIAAIREAAVPGTAINIGTAEAPVQVIVIQRNPDGVIVNTPDGQTRQMTYEEFGNYVGVNAVPMTDAQIDEQEADALAADRAQREAALDQEYDNDDAALEELAEAEDEIEQAVDSTIPLPMKADGSVDQNALWNKDPERWAQWNDEQRQDGGANSLAYVSGAIAKEQAKIAELQAAYAAESDFDARDAIEKEIADTQARVERLTAIQQGYVAQAEAAPVVETQQKPQTEEEKTKAENQRREPLRRKAKELADKLGVKVNIAESISDVKEGQAKEEILRIDLSGSKERATGWYNPVTGEVTIYLPHTTDVKEIERTIVHEVVAHKGLRGLLGEDGFNVLCDSVWEMMTEEERAKYMAYPGVNGNKRAAADEFIAHYAETLNLEESKPVWDRIMDLVMRILDSMGVNLDITKEELSDIIVASYQNLIKEAEESKETITETEVAEVINEEQLNAPNSGEAQQITASDGEVLADTNGKGAVRFSIRTWNEGGRDYLAAWLANDKTLTDDEKADILARMDEFYKNALLYSDTYAPFGTWSDAGVRYDNNGNPLMSVIKANGDYAMNLDFSLVCKKRRPLNRLLRTLVNRNAFATYTLRERELAEINWILQEHGFEVACALCFVDSKRYRVTGVADVFAKLWNNLVTSLAPKGVEIAHFNYNDNPNVAVVENGLDTLPDDQLDWKKLDKAIARFKEGSVEHKVAQYLREHPEARKLVDATDFIEAEGFESVKEQNPDLLKFYNMKKGTGGPKASFGDVQYLNDILKKEKTFDADKAYAVGGVRLQSFSDFVPHMYFDYMQLFAELAAKKLPVHAYTKEVLFAKIFGLTGAKINLSLVPAVVEGGIAPGLDAEGNYAWADPVTDEEGNVIQQGQSFPYDEALAIQQAEGYSKNCGIIAVGISDAHIEKMLDDPNIPFIIPYHKSSLNAIVARMTNIDQYKDYTNVQNTRKASGSKLDKGTKDFNFNEYLHGLGESGTPQQAAQAYLDWCRENNYKPKFSQFAYHPNYYKLLQDFNTIDLATGEYAPQGAVTMTFPTEESAFGNVETLIQQGLREDAELEEKMEQEIDGIADRVLARLEEISKEPKMSEKQQAKKMAELADERMAKIKKRSGAIDLVAEAERVVAEQKQKEMRDGVAFRVIGENETPREFLQKEVDAYRSRFKEVAPITLVDINSKSQMARVLGMQETDLTDEDMRDIREDIETKNKWGGYGFDSKEIAIFVREKVLDSKRLEMLMMHESIHALTARNKDFLWLGQYMWVNAKKDATLLGFRSQIAKKEPKNRWYDEMAAYVISLHMENGTIAELESLLDAANRDRLNDLLNELGYDKESETAARDTAFVLRDNGYAEVGSEDSQKKGEEGKERVENEGASVSFRITPEQDKAYMDAVNAGDMETAQKMVIEAAKLAMPNTKVVDENGNPKVVYHGSTAMFTVFDKSRIGSATGTADGRGFYFTTDRDYALGYKTSDGQLFEVFLNIEKPLSYDKKTITKAQLRKILKEADRVEYEQEGEHYMLSNYANYNDVGIDAAVNEAANLEYDYADNDVELVGSLIGGSGSFDLIMDAVKKVTGKSGMIAPKDNGTIHYVVTDPAGIKSAETVTYDNDGNVIPLSERFNPENEDIRFRVSNDNQAIFVSNAAKAVEGIKQEKATPEQWLKMIEKNGGLKAGEDKWMGLSDFLKSSDKKTLTKQEVLDFINENMIVIEETHYLQYAEEAAADSHREIVDKLQEKFNAYVAEYHEQNPDADEYADPAGEYAIEKLREEMEDTFPYTIEKVYGNEVYVTFDYEDMEEMEKWSEKLGVVYDPQYQIDSTRLNYTTSGLDEKHEIALTVPTIESWNVTDEVHFGEAGEGRAVAWIRFGETVKFQERYPKAEWDAVKKFEEENGAYSLWTDDLKSEYSRLLRAFYKAQNRKKVLVIDEIQSKRHQEGREKGYRTSREDVAKATEAFQSFNRAMKEKYGENVFPSKWSEEDQAEFDRLRDEHARVSKSYDKGIPAAPFDKNWHELAMKRMLRYAAENGYDAIAWTKGEQQAERYNLGEVVDNVTASAWDSFAGWQDVKIISAEPRDGGELQYVVDKEGKIVADVNDQYEGRNIAEMFGKEIAVKLLAEGEVNLSNAELRLGGEGMKGFYDKMLPAFMNKYGKKWGVKVEDIELPNLEDGLTMHSVPVTDEMKASVLEGQVMFRTIPITQEVQDEMDAIKASAIVMGNYLKAPNGADTNLTPEQWAMVRTKAFKAWFGDWEKPFRLEKLRKSVNAFLKGDEIEITDDYKQNKKNAMEVGRSLKGTYTNADTGRSIELTSSKKNGGLPEILEHDYKDAEHILSIAAIPQIIENAIFIDSRENEDKAKHPNIEFYEYYVCGLTIGGEEYTVKAVVSNMTEGKRYYDHKLTSIEKGRLIDLINNKAPESSVSITTQTPETDALSEVKDKRLIPILKADFSKVIDENGEPKVVYHGSPNEFNTFDEDMIGENTDSGFYGRGFYFATTEEESRGYGKYVIPAFLSMQNPLDLNELYAISDKWDGTTADGAVRWWYGLASLFPNDAISETVYASIGGEDWTIMDLKNRIDELAETSDTPFADAAEEFGIDEDFFDMMGEEDVNLPDELTDALKANGYDGVINAGVENNELVALYPNQIKSATDNTGEFSKENDDIRFKVVTDPAKIEELEDGPKVEAYRAVQIDKNGKIYSPMASRLKSTKKGTKQATNEAAQMNQWDEAVESLDKVDENGRITILDEDGGTTKVSYNPYGHCCVNSMMNDQFKRAWERDGLYVMKVLAPESELTAGYHAEKAKDAVGIHKWKTGAVGNKLPENKRREILLTRWMKNVKVMPWEAVAQDWIDTLDGENIDVPFNVVPRKILNMLAEAGVKIVAPEKGMENATKAYEQWLADPEGYVGNTELPDHVKALNEETDDEGPDNEPRFRTTGTPTDEVVANGLDLTPAQTAEVAANIFAALPEESRKKITDGLNGNVLGLKDAILQIPASLASKENWNDEDKQMADVVAEEMTKMAGEITRPFSAEEGLWLLYNNLNKGTDLISQASRALVQRNLGFDAETLAKQEQAKEDVRFRTVGDATSNAKASLYNRGAVNVWTRLKESFVDMQASVEELVKAIEERTGKVAQGFENILLALNQQSSKGLAAMESYTQKFLNPMFDEIRKIMDETKMKYEDVVRYVILKHGLERNKKLAQRDARAHYQEIYDDIISKITGMTAAQKRTYLTNAQLKEGDAKAELAALQAVAMSSMTDEEKREHKKRLAVAHKAVEEAEEHLDRAQKIASLSEQEAQDELDKILEKIENGTDSVYKEMRENDYSGISSMFYDQLGVDRKNFSTEEQYQAALMEAKKDRYSSLKDIEAAAEAEVKSFEGKTDTKELWKRINAATKETLRQQYEANMISKDQYLNLRDMFEYYVPLRGFKDNTAEDMYTYYRKPNSTGYTKPILGAEGRKTEAESPFGWIAAMAGSAIASNVKNEAKLALYYFVSNRPENGIATISKTWFVDSGEVDERGKKIFKPAYPPFSEDLSSAEGKAQYEIWQANMKELQKKGQAYEAGQRLNLGNAVVNISDANKPEHIVNVKVGGKDYTIIINGNPRAAQAINGDLNIEGTAQDYSALFGPVLRWMSSVNTSYNPEFWITNMMRDMAFTMMAVNIKEDPAYRRKFSKNYRKAFKVISLVAKNEKGTIGDSYLEQQYKDFVKYGGVTGYTQIKDSETWEQEIENYLSSNDPKSVKNGKVMRGMKSAFHAAHRFGESLEQVSRFAAFLTARETGKSINEAINDAKEITVNFNRKGSGKMITLEEAKYLTGKNGQPLTKPQQWMVVGLSSIAPLGRRFIMFFNAAIQGLNATYKLMKKNPKRFTGWALGYAAVGMMNAVLHAMLDDDDDYLDIPQYERRNSLMIGGNGAYFKWALPQEARAFYALGDLAVETVMGRNPHQNFLGEALKIGTEILPVNPSEGWKAFMPSVAIPFIELALNEDYKGAPIYNDQKWLSEEEKERTAKWSSAYQGTGWTYVKISQGLNFITGGDKHDAGLINLQPEKLEHLVQSAFGGTIRTADKFINTISAAIDPEESVTIRQTPFLNRFLTINDERFKNVHVNDVFDYYKADAEHALTLEKQYIKDRDMDSLTELRSSDEYQWAKIYSKYKKPLKAIQDKIKVADGTAEKKELMKQQDELKKRMIKEISEL